MTLFKRTTAGQAGELIDSADRAELEKKKLILEIYAIQRSHRFWWAQPAFVGFAAAIVTFLYQLQIYHDQNERWKADNSRLQEANARLKEERALLEQSLAASQDMLIKTREEVRSLTDRRSQLENSLQVASEQRTQLEVESDKLGQVNRELSSKMSSLRLEREKLTNSYNQLVRDEAKTRATCGELLKEITALQGDVAKRSTELASLSSKHENLEGLYNDRLEQYEAMTVAVKEAEEELTALATASATKNEEVEELTGRLRKLRDSEQYGLLITETYPSAIGGVRFEKNDVLVSVDGKAVGTILELRDAYQNAKDSFKVVVWNCRSGFYESFTIQKNGSERLGIDVRTVVTPANGSPPNPARSPTRGWFRSSRVGYGESGSPYSGGTATGQLFAESGAGCVSADANSLRTGSV